MILMKLKLFVFILAAVLSVSQSLKAQVPSQGKDIYLDLMEEAAKAYTPERIEDYIARTQKEGILEHGFARLASNIGILVSKGPRSLFAT